MTSLNAQSNPISASHTSASAVLWHTIRFPNTPPFLLGVGYLAPSEVASDSVATEAICKSLQLAAAVGLPLVLVGDFNLRHPDWLDFNGGGNPVPPQTFATYLSTASMTVLNAVLMPGQYTRPSDREGSTVGSIIDLAITNAPHLVVAMDTDFSHSLDSDHYPITMTMDLKPQQPPSPEYSRPRTQWSVRRHVERWQRELPLALDTALAHWPLPILVRPLPSDALAATNAAQAAIDAAYSSLESTLLSSFELSVGTHQTSNKSKAWFAVPGVRSAYDHMKSARRIWKHSRTPNLLKRRAAALALAQWKDTVAKAKTAAWAAMCSSIQADPKSTLRWTVFKRSRGSDRRSLGSFPIAMARRPLTWASRSTTSARTSSHPPSLPLSRRCTQIVTSTIAISSRGSPPPHPSCTLHCRLTPATAGPSLPMMSSGSATRSTPTPLPAAIPSLPSSSAISARPRTRHCRLCSPSHGSMASCRSSGRKPTSWRCGKAKGAARTPHRSVPSP